MKYYGYARISTKKQSLDRQIENICKYEPTAEIIKETFSGTTAKRPQWQSLKAKALKAAANGGEVTIIFDSVSRMSRNASEGLEDYFELFGAGIELVFLKEPQINTATYKADLPQLAPTVNTTDSAADEMINSILTAINKYQRELAARQIVLAFAQAEKEVKDLQQRTKEGMKASGAAAKISKAKAGTNYTTKKAKKKKELIKALSKDFDGEKTDKECITLCGISRNSFYKYKAELKAEIAKEEK